MIKKLVLSIIISIVPSFLGAHPFKDEQEFLYYLQQHLSAGRAIDEVCDVKTSNNGMTFLHAAAEYGYDQAIRQLLELNASLEVVDEKGRVPLHYAALNTRSGSMRLLLDKLVTYPHDTQQAIINAQDYKGQTPLHEVFEYPIDKDTYETACLLIRAGAHPNAANNNGCTPLHRLVTLKGDHKLLEKTIQLFLAHGASAQMRDGNGDTALHMAVAEGSSKTVKQLLTQGAASSTLIQVCNNEKNTPLHVACWFGSYRKAALLLLYGADPALKNEKQQTALMTLLNNTSSDEEQDLDEVNNNDKKRTKIAELLYMDPRTDLSAQDEEGNTLLYAVASCGISFTHLLPLLEVLKDKVNARNNDYKTPLFNTVLRGDVLGTLYLLQAGAHALVFDRNGFAPLSHALSAEDFGQETKLQLAQLLSFYQLPSQPLLIWKKNEKQVTLDRQSSSYLQDHFKIDKDLVDVLKNGENFHGCRQFILKSFLFDRYKSDECNLVRKSYLTDEFDLTDKDDVTNENNLIDATDSIDESDSTDKIIRTVQITKLLRERELHARWPKLH